MRNKNKKLYFLDYVFFTCVFCILFALVIQRSIKNKISNPSESTSSVKINCDSPVWKNKPRCN